MYSAQLNRTGCCTYLCHSQRKSSVPISLQSKANIGQSAKHFKVYWSISSYPLRSHIRTDLMFIPTTRSCVLISVSQMFEVLWGCMYSLGGGFASNKAGRLFFKQQLLGDSGSQAAVILLVACVQRLCLEKRQMYHVQVLTACYSPAACLESFFQFSCCSCCERQ